MTTRTNQAALSLVPPATAKTRAAKPASATRKPAPSKAERRSETAAARRQRWSSVAVAGVTTVMLGVSLSHLAHGIDTVAHVGPLDA